MKSILTLKTVSLVSIACSDTHVLRNISCPVSPIGSPILHARSPRHFNGRMSPSPISSPRTTLGSCTPLTGGAAVIPFHQMTRTFYMHEGFGHLPIPSSSSIHSSGGGGGAPCLVQSPDVFRGVQKDKHLSSEVVSSNVDVLGKQYEVRTLGVSCIGRSVLTDRVSRQLLRDQVKVNLSLDVGPSSQFPSRCNGNLT